jgi:hypothetical protein
MPASTTSDPVLLLPHRRDSATSNYIFDASGYVLDGLQL